MALKHEDGEEESSTLSTNDSNIKYNIFLSFDN